MRVARCVVASTSLRRATDCTNPSRCLRAPGSPGGIDSSSASLNRSAPGGKPIAPFRPESRRRGQRRTDSRNHRNRNTGSCAVRSRRPRSHCRRDCTAGSRLCWDTPSVCPPSTRHSGRGRPCSNRSFRRSRAQRCADRGCRSRCGLQIRARVAPGHLRVRRRRCRAVSKGRE